jgi:hypothetical protein
MALCRLIKEHILLGGVNPKDKTQKIPRAHSSASGLNKLTNRRGESDQKHNNPIKSSIPEEGGQKRGLNHLTFLSLYHALLIDYPGRKRVYSFY